jgi:hypothetical protein
VALSWILDLSCMPEPVYRARIPRPSSVSPLWDLCLGWGLTASTHLGLPRPVLALSSLLFVNLPPFPPTPIVPEVLCSLGYLFLHLLVLTGSVIGSAPKITSFLSYLLLFNLE